MSEAVFDRTKVRPTGILLLAIWDLLFAALLLVGAIVIGAFTLRGESAVGPAIAALLAAIYGGLHLLAGLGLLRLAPWARLLRVVLAVVELLGFPLLTFVSILVLVMLVNAPMRALFAARPLPGVPPPERSAGLVPGVLILLTIAAAPFVFIVAAIAIPNLLNAIDRGKQKRTMADMRSLATAVEAYSIDHDLYPQVGSLAELIPHVEPTYIRKAPAVDGWGHPIVFGATEDGGYQMFSPGKDGLEDEVWPGGGTSDFDADIVFQDGRIVQWPEGQQQ